MIEWALCIINFKFEGLAMIENKQVIVSLTTYPARMHLIHSVIDSIVNQTVKVDKIVLTLSEEEFPDRVINIDFSEYELFGFEIIWCKNCMKSHQKYFYTMLNYPNAIIITVDDDIIYENRLIETLLDGYKNFPDCVVTARAHQILFSEEVDADGIPKDIISYNDWNMCCWELSNVPRYDLVATGVGGVLYPPKDIIFKEEAFSAEAIAKYCPHADDLWLKIMEIRNNIPVVLVADHMMGKEMDELSDTGLYLHENAGDGNDRQLVKLFDVYGKKDLIKKMYSANSLNAKQFWNKVEETYNANIDTISRYKKIIFYGAGLWAERMHNMLNNAGMSERIVDIWVTQIGNGVTTKWGIGINRAEDKMATFDEDTIVVIAIARDAAIRVKQYLLENINEQNILLFDPLAYKYIYFNQK